jgi:hypothetical protein
MDTITAGTDMAVTVIITAGNTTESITITGRHSGTITIPIDGTAGLSSAGRFSCRVGEWFSAITAGGKQDPRSRHRLP